MNIPKVIRKYCAKCKTHTDQKVSIYKAGKRRGSARGERRHAERKQGYGGQKFPKLAKPAKVTKKVTPIMTCTVCKKKYNKTGVRIKKFELVAARRKIISKFQNHQVSFRKLIVKSVVNYK